MKTYIILIIIGSLLASCTNQKEWKEHRNINLEEVTPIGLTYFDDLIWVSDGDNNKLVSIDKKGKKITTIENFDRPMHIDSDGENIYIPEYGLDKITKLKSNSRTYLEIQDSLDAPAGISTNNGKIAIADFYNHQVIFYNGSNWQKIGAKGKKDGEFHYPTDVQIANSNLYVADAYNHRVQIFNLQGEFLKVVGEKDSMNATTGIFVSENELFATDFENNRVLVYDLEGNKKQIINKNLDKPTDILLINNELYIANYGGKNIVVYQNN